MPIGRAIGTLKETVNNKFKSLIVGGNSIA
jgi:hypothetical protein